MNDILTGGTKITLLGAGGAGRSILDRIRESGLKGVKIAGSDLADVRACVEGADLVLVLAGMGGRTVLEEAPLFAEAAKSSGALVVGVVTTPFGFEQGVKLRLAQEGIARLKEHADALIVLDNSKLAQGITDAGTAYRKSDEVICRTVRGITDFMTTNGFVNLDFEDIKSMFDSGEGKISVCSVGIGEAEGEGRAERAAREAVESPMMTRPLGSASRILLNVTTGVEITLNEMAEAARVIEENVSEDSDVIWGHVIDDALGDRVRATIFAVYSEEAAVK